MKDEIKEILDSLKGILDEPKGLDEMPNGNLYEYDRSYDLEQDEIKLLLDYITNLQEENNKLNNRIESIKKDNQNLMKDLCHNSSGLLFYKSKNKKAIEYINHEIFKRTILVGVGTKKYIRNILDNVLNILNGGDDNE